MSTWIFKVEKIRRHVKHPRDYTTADWLMWSIVGIVVAAAVVGAAIS